MAALADAALSGLDIAAARRRLAAALRDGGLASPELDARILIGTALGLDLTGLAVHAARILTPSQAQAIAHLARRRLAGEPVARIAGVREFWSLALELSPATLVPRPETETVVEAALDAVRGSARAAPRIADIGTGSGAIALALLSELPRAGAVATDLSPAALVTARANARALGLEARCHFVACDYAAALAGPFDLIVSNPPYIRSADLAALPREVRDHDPRLALDGGADGLTAYRHLARDAIRLLAPGGALVVEVGYDQAADVGALMRVAGLSTPHPPRADIAGIPRAVTGYRSPG
ncbi:MAG: peptide chain release factor N(5)-glutamine methyltransferase [Xanthobacteraceae bacterium]|nr:MAG: peptide chain release factor N(5)-glutamine methyltransferase [Xanthobacteraceae bacterium]